MVRSTVLRVDHSVIKIRFLSLLCKSTSSFIEMLLIRHNLLYIKIILNKNVSEIYISKRFSLILVQTSGVSSVMVIVVGNSYGDASSKFLDGTVCISYCANTFGKGVNPTILPPAMGK